MAAEQRPAPSRQPASPSGRIAVWLFERNEAPLQKHGGSGETLLASFSKHGYSIHYWDEERKRLGKKGDESDLERENYLACQDVGVVGRRIANQPDVRRPL